MSESAHADSKTHTWRPGAALFDRYQLLGVIGQGGMGTVYKAYHLSLKRFVAIKVLRIDQIPSPEMKGRFLREMEAVGQMDHPNIVRASDAGKNNGVFYLVMEYLEGSDLSRLVTTHGALGMADACELTRQTAEGLDYIHRTLVHRDIKPSNLILTTSGVVKILDLGLARLHEIGASNEFTPTGSAVGTYDYLAPEQAVASSRVDARADIYSLGCTLFKLVTGRPPFPGPDYDSAARKLHAHGNVPLTASPDFASVPEALRPILLRMTAKNPDDRYPNAREVADALAPFAVDSQPVRLVRSKGAAAAPALRPMPAVKPDDLGQLTASPHDTPFHIAGTLALPMPDLALRRRSPLPIIGVGVLLACALAGAAWLVAPALFRLLARPPVTPSSNPAMVEGTEAGPRNLDKLDARTWHPLLDREPFPIPPDDGRRRIWRRDAGEQRIHVDGGDFLMLELGTTSQPSFTFETGAAQSPWTGHVGLCWGYHEETAVKAARTPNQEFGWFQMLCVKQEINNAGGNLHFVQRVRGALKYDARGDISGRLDFVESQKVPLPSGEMILQIIVNHDCLESARFGAVDLTNLYSDLVNNKFKADPCRGGLGVITLSPSVRFSNARFLAE